MRQYLEFELNAWREPTITVNTLPGSTSINGGVAQYEFQSMQALQNKLEQFPAGTTFVLRVSGQDTQAVRAAEEAVSTFIRARRMNVVMPQ